MQVREQYPHPIARACLWADSQPECALENALHWPAVSPPLENQMSVWEQQPLKRVACACAIDRGEDSDPKHSMCQGAVHLPAWVSVCPVAAAPKWAKY